MAAAAIPALVSVGGSLLGKMLSKPSAAQSAAQTNTGADATALSAMGTQATNAAMPMFQGGQQQQQQGGASLRASSGYLQQAGQYYNSILGSRSAANASLAPEMTTANNLYSGNANKISRTMRGGSRDYALAENDRAKVGQMASYLPQARAGAAQGAERVASGFGQNASQYGQYASNLFGAGSSLYNTGVSARTGAGYLNSNLFNNATKIGDQQAATGKSIGSMIFDLLKGVKFGGGPSSGTGAPTGSADAGTGSFYGPPSSSAYYGPNQDPNPYSPGNTANGGGPTHQDDAIPLPSTNYPQLPGYTGPSY